MKFLYIALIFAAVLAIRIGLFKRRRQRRRSASEDTVQSSGAPDNGDQALRSDPCPVSPTPPPDRRRSLEDSLGDVGKVAAREIRERIRGRIFRVGTLIILVAVGAAIVIPTITKSSSGPTSQSVGVVGSLSPTGVEFVHVAASSNHDRVTFVHEPSLAAARADLRSQKIDLAIVNSDRIVLSLPAAQSNAPADPGMVLAVAEYLGVLKAYTAAGLTPTQAALVTGSKAVPVSTLSKSSKSSTKATSVIGIVLLFLMLTQYCTWILMGVMQEKASRVVEVLLATVRPIQLLGGKVLGIGLVALGQAALIVSFALIVGAAVGSDLLKGTGPLVLACELLWLVLGYSFYCWLYAAAGSTAERQDQVQTLALPLSIPILLGYIFSITVASTGHPNVFFKILAYLPPTAPFCMSVLVGLNDVRWWQFVASVLLSLAGTAGMALFAARIYRRAVLRTGGRVRIRQLLAHNRS
jgi:ABC-2 type transport system permease protein